MRAEPPKIGLEAGRTVPRMAVVLAVPRLVKSFTAEAIFITELQLGLVKYVDLADKMVADREVDGAEVKQR